MTVGTLQALNDATAAGFAAAGLSKLALTGSVSRPLYSKLADQVSVRDFGAKGDITTNDTAAFAAAAAASDSVYVPPGIYRVENLDIPDKKTIWGPGQLRPISACDHVIQVGNDCRVEGIIINGNNVANKGLKLNGHFTNVTGVQAQNCVYGMYNVGFDILNFSECRTTTNTYGIYSANRFITCNIDKHYSGLETYFLYMTYSDQQPQFVNISNSSIETATYGVYCAKDIYFLKIGSTSFNSISQNAITLGPPAPGVGSDIYIGDGTYIAALNQAIMISPGWFNVNIDNVGMGDSTGGLVSLTATTTLRTTRVNITNSNFGQSGSQSIYADSVDGLNIIGCVFAPTFAAPYDAIRDIVLPTTFVGTTPKALVQGNKFQKAAPYAPGANIDSYDNTGWTTKAVGVAPMPSGQVTIDITHGLSATPLQVFVTPKGNLGSVWVTNIGAATFRVNCSAAPGADTPFSWEARCDP